MSRCFLWLFFHTLHENRKLRDTHGNNKNILLPPACPDTQLRRHRLIRLSRTFRGSSVSARHLDGISWSEIRQLSCLPSMRPSARRTMCALPLSSPGSSCGLLLSCVLGCTCGPIQVYKYSARTCIPVLTNTKHLGPLYVVELLWCFFIFPQMFCSLNITLHVFLEYGWHVSFQYKHKFNKIVFNIHVQLVSVSWYWHVF